MRDEQDMPALVQSFADQFAGEDGLAGAGRRHEQEATIACRDLSLDISDGHLLIGSEQVAAGHDVCYQAHCWPFSAGRFSPAPWVFTR